MRGRHKDAEAENDQFFNLDRPSRPATQQHQHRASIGRKVSARPPSEVLQKARTPAELLKLRPTSVDARDGGEQSGSSQIETAVTSSSATAQGTDAGPESRRSSHHHGHRLTFHDVLRWLQKEQARRAASKARKSLAKKAKKHASRAVPAGEPAISVVDQESVEGESSRRTSNASSEGELALEMLREIMEQQMHMTLPSRSSFSSLRKSHSVRSLRKLRRHSTAASSDTDFDKEPLVPTCDVLLDNSKTMSYSGSTAVDNDSRPHLKRSISAREQEAWKMFKLEITKLAHTLKLPGWRRVPFEETDKIDVQRLSGALTNAVYVVSPPSDFRFSGENDGKARKSKPDKLLLRIYGSQVDHLIDRESELQILRRLSKKHIGPRLLGTFLNGRFEEYLNARTLTAEDLRMPDISRQIAKRMRELHDGIELLDSEIQAGPFVFQNINKWMMRAENVVTWLENSAAKGNEVTRNLSVKDHFVGSKFALFKQAVKKYQVWLESQYSKRESDIRNRLVFAHNDVSSGNSHVLSITNT
jgi:choline kinase